MTKLALKKSRRSGTRPCEVCGEVRLLVEHHINGRDIPRAEDAWNRVAICPNCHDDLHATPPRLLIQEWVMTSEGRQLVWHRLSQSP